MPDTEVIDPIEETLEDEIQEAAQEFQRPSSRIPISPQENSQSVDLDQLQEQIRREEAQRKLIDSLVEKLAKGEELSDNERVFIGQQSPDGQRSIQAMVGQRISQSLNPVQQQLFQQDPEFQHFARERFRTLENGGSQVLQITDTHTTPEKLENIIRQRMIEADFDVDRDVLVHTGDIILDFFDPEIGSKAYSVERILEEGKLHEHEEKFKEAYKSFLRFAGVSDSDLKGGKLFAGQQGAQTRNYINALLDGSLDPRNLSDDEIKQFRKARFEVQGFIREGILNHARTHYNGVREVLERQGLTNKNFASIPGNHDVIEVMNEVLGDYVMKPGKTEFNNGLKGATFLAGSNGPVLGDSFNDLYGLVPSERRQALRHENDLFKELRSAANEYGLEFTDSDIDRMHQLAIQRESNFGIRPKGGLVDYFERIENEVDKTIKRDHVDSIPDIDLSDVHFILNHGQLDHPMYSSVEEKEVLRRIEAADNDVHVYNGHMHGQRVGINNGVLHINSGSSLEGNAIINLYGADNKFESGLRQTYNRVTNTPEFTTYSRERGLTNEKTPEYLQ